MWPRAGKPTLPMKIKISLRAQDDLGAIYNYAAQKWGYGQAETYRRDIDAHFRMIADHPEIGLVIPNDTGMRKFPMKHHLIFYKVSTESVFIYRVYHNSDFPGLTLLEN